jgi:phage terminase large subunit GpA-like protein
MRLFAPPPKLTVSQWADRYRRLSSEASAEPGIWRTDRAPYQRGVMDAVADDTVREIWVMKSAQVGWTEILNNVIGYHVAQDQAPMLLVQPTLEMAEAWSKDRLAPMVRDTPALSELIADPRSRDSGNTLLHKKFPGGHLTVAGANSPAGLASRPIRVVLFDEVDRYPASAGTEGDPVSLGKKRTATFWNRKVLAGSTPTIKGSSRIEAGFESGDQRLYFVPCTHCGEMQRLVWSQVRWPDGDPAAAAYVCVACGAELGDADKAEMLRAGEWRATRESRGIASFHISELYSPWSTWGEMAVAFLEAKKLPETLQTWINTSLGETFEERGDGVAAVGLAARREPYTAQSLPGGALVLTCGVDVQDDRLEASVWAWGRDEEAWLVEHQVLPGDPGSESLWADLDAFLNRPRSREDGRQMLIEATCVDSGGHFTQQVYGYCARRKARRIWAVKGAGGFGRLVFPKRAGRAGKTSAQLYIVGVDTAKDVLFGRLKRVVEPGAGYVHFPASVDDVYFDQLTAETMVYRVVQGRRMRSFKPKSAGARTEALDCFVYAYAAFVGRGGGNVLTARRDQVAADVAAVEPVVEDKTEAVPVAPRRVPLRRPPRGGGGGGWMNGWR